MVILLCLYFTFLLSHLFSFVIVLSTVFRINLPCFWHGAAMPLSNTVIYNFWRAWITKEDKLTPIRQVVTLLFIGACECLFHPLVLSRFYFIIFTVHQLWCILSLSHITITHHYYHYHTSLLWCILYTIRQVVLLLFNGACECLFYIIFTVHQLWCNVNVDYRTHFLAQ